MALIFKGSEVAAALTAELSSRAAALAASGTVPTLAILRVGERADDVAYESSAVKRCAAVGIAVKHFRLAGDCTRSELLRAINEVNEDPSIHGCLMLRPLPKKRMMSPPVLHFVRKRTSMA